MNYRMSILIVELQRSSKLNAENFMKEFGKKFNGHPLVEFVDVGNRTSICGDYR